MTGLAEPIALLFHLISPVGLIMIFCWSTQEFINAIPKAVEESVAAWEKITIAPPEEVSCSLETRETLIS